MERFIHIEASANTVDRFLIELIIGNFPHHRLLYRLMDHSFVLQINIYVAAYFYGITRKNSLFVEYHNFITVFNKKIL